MTNDKLIYVDPRGKFRQTFTHYCVFVTIPFAIFLILFIIYSLFISTSELPILIYPLLLFAIIWLIFVGRYMYKIWPYEEPLKIYNNGIYIPHMIAKGGEFYNFDDLVRIQLDRYKWITFETKGSKKHLITTRMVKDVDEILNLIKE